MKVKLSIIIPVLNESGIIQNTLDSIYETCRRISIEIVVIDGDPEGSTIKSIKRNGIKTGYSRKGRGGQCNAGAEMANGDVLLFLHADTSLPDNACSMVESSLRNTDAVGGAFDLKFDNRSWKYRLHERLISLRSRITRIPFGDQAFFFKRDFFYSIGGFADIPLMEDLELMRRIRKMKKKIVIINKRVVTSARKYEEEGIIYATLRNWVLQILYSAGVSPARLMRFYYRGNRN